MLVLSRKIGERIVIGGDVVVTVLGVRGGQLRLGIEAPNSTTILRAELADFEPPCHVAAVAEAEGLW